jgi:hypothetical protein
LGERCLVLDHDLLLAKQHARFNVFVARFVVEAIAKHRIAIISNLEREGETDHRLLVQACQLE